MKIYSTIYDIGLESGIRADVLLITFAKLPQTIIRSDFETLT